MPRKPRELVAGGLYRVYARANRRQLLFLDDDDRRQYLAVWGSVARDLGWRCLAYCLMDNHVHHVVETPNPDLSYGVQLAHGTYGRRFNDSDAKDGHVFQGRFGSSRAATPGALWYFVTYVVLNPVRAGMCPRPADYAWSSHRAVIGAAAAPRWLDVARLLSFYGDTRPLDRYTQIVDAIQEMGTAGFEPPPDRL